MPDTYFNSSINQPDNSAQTQGAAGEFNVGPGVSSVSITAAAAGATAPTLPPAAGAVGASVVIVNQGGGLATVAASAGDSPISGTATVADGTAGIFASDGVSTWVRVLIA
jgi:hypothetical protein